MEAPAAESVDHPEDSAPRVEGNTDAVPRSHRASDEEQSQEMQNRGNSKGSENPEDLPRPLPGLTAAGTLPPAPPNDLGPSRRVPLGTHETGQELAKTLMQFVRAVNNDLVELKSAMEQGKQGHIIPPSIPSPDKTASTHPWIDVKLGTRFYPCDGLFDLNGKFRTACQEHMDEAVKAAFPPPTIVQLHMIERLPHPSHSNYFCRGDPNYLIRVLYDSKPSNSGEVSELGERPDAASIDIVGFMVASKPIADFFEKRLGLNVGQVRILKFGRPFRSVIRNMQHIREQLSYLASKYGHTTDVEASKKGVMDNERFENDSSHQSDDQGPNTPPPDKTQDKEESYDQQVALDHFLHFIRFIEQYLIGKLNLFRTLREGTRDKVAYEDLWMLFDTGDKIYSPQRQSHTVARRRSMSVGGSYSGSDSDDDQDIFVTRRRYVPQAYRVLTTIGGSPLTKSWAPKNVKVENDYLSDDFLLELFLGRSKRPIGLTVQNQQADVQPKQRIKERFSPLHVLCMYVDFDGLRYGTETDVFIFRPFDGEISIKSLEAYPTQYALSPRADYLLQRGRKFVDVTTSSKHMKHTGFTVGESREEVHSAVVVDLKLASTEYQKEFPDDDAVIPFFQTFKTEFWPAVDGELSDLSGWEFHPRPCHHGPYCLGDSCFVSHPYRSSQRSQLEKLEPKIQEVLEEFDYPFEEKGEIDRFKTYLEEQDLIELLPGVVPGFALRNRTWVQLNLDQLDYVEKEDEWKKLTLPKGHKQIVQAMVVTHSGGSQNNVGDEVDEIEMDLVRGKGDVGYEPEDVERNMGKHFKLAHRWGCVLLLDEADVFLAKRNKTDVKRNGLVSSFLRILEYYSGILFLTTNRVGAIDDAFRSRLHLTLYYPKLTKKQTLRIWKTNLQRLKEINVERLNTNREPIEFNSKKIGKWVSKHWKGMNWNGRQIRNAFQTAAALAEFKAKRESAKHPESPTVHPSLDIKQFRLLVKASNQFNDYLHLTHGDDEDQRAVLDQVRAVPAPSKSRAKIFSDDDEDEDDDEDDEDDESVLGSESETDEDSSESSDDNSGTNSEDDDSEDENNKSKKRGKKSRKGKAKARKDQSRDKAKGRKK
ncbi:hypothetical protein N0V82_004942 [Gnomoniopsis sp. IMI 355080]|nr:hypothetical protein N0V82_004942 [Gnomoniopsis sp. IMI 355080]